MVSGRDGGNAGAVLAGFLFKAQSLSYAQGLFILGACILAASTCAFVVRFSENDEYAAKKEIEARLAGAYVPAVAAVAASGD